MRDPKRIRKFCNQIADIWESSCPDFRFGQLVENICSSGGIQELFYVEDEEFLECAQKAILDFM